MSFLTHGNSSVSLGLHQDIAPLFRTYMRFALGSNRRSVVLLDGCPCIPLQVHAQHRPTHGQDRLGPYVETPKFVPTSVERIENTGQELVMLGERHSVKSLSQWKPCTSTYSHGLPTREGVVEGFSLWGLIARGVNS